MGAKALRLTARDLYELDFLEWTARNAALLRAGRFQEADIEHIAEEIDDMGKSQQEELSSRLRVLLVHLLKWQFQPERRSNSWEETMDAQRSEILDLLDFMPSLGRAVSEMVTRVYPRARREAAKQTGLPQGRFPDTCPFTPDQILDDTFLP